MKRTPQQNSQLHAICSKLGIDAELKAEMVWEYTKGRETSTAELQIDECQAMINHLNHLAKNKGADPDFIKADKMRKKIISIAHEMNWKLANQKIDMKRLNKFCQDRTYGHKNLDEYTLRELPELVTQFEQVLKAFYKTDHAKT